MFEIFAEESVITVLMLFCMAISVFLRIFLGLLYRHIIKEADNMASTDNKMLKQCKLKFAHCYQLSNGVANIPVFVDKFINRLTIGRISFSMIYHLSGQSMLLSVVFSGVGICRSIIRGKTLGDILPFYIVSFIGLYIYFSVSTVMDVKGKRRMLKVNLVDYLENHLSPRISVTNQDLEMLYGEEIYDDLPGMTKRLGNGKSPRGGRLGAGGRVNRKTVEFMPIGGKLSLEEKKDLLDVADRLSDLRTENRSEGQESSKNRENPDVTAVTEEELETLLREFLAT